MQAEPKTSSQLRQLSVRLLEELKQLSSYQLALQQEYGVLLDMLSAGD